MKTVVGLHPDAGAVTQEEIRLPRRMQAGMAKRGRTQADEGGAGMASRAIARSVTAFM
jgi:hypothetical protein